MCGLKTLPCHVLPFSCCFSGASFYCILVVLLNGSKHFNTGIFVDFSKMVKFDTNNIKLQLRLQRTNRSQGLGLGQGATSHLPDPHY